MTRKQSGLLAFSLASMTILAPIPVLASEAVLALEREQLLQDCTDIEFLEGYLTQVEANGDGLPDYLVNTQRLMCDGSQMMWCGTLGCVHRIWIQQPDGSFKTALETYAYEIVFDRPGDTSFLVRTRDGSSRQNLATQAAANATPGGPTTSMASMNQWSFQPAPAPVAAVGGQDSLLSLACDSGQISVRYTAHWMSGEDQSGDFLKDWNESGIVATFDTTAVEFDLPMQLAESGDAFVAKDALGFDSALVDALSRGRRLTIHHGGSLEHELGFTLKGSSAAIRALRANCG